MSDLKRQLNEDRAIRNAARSIITAQIAQIRQGVSGQRIGEKLADKIGDDAAEFLGKTGKAAQDNRGPLLAFAGVVVAAVAWKPLVDLLKSLKEDGTADEAEVIEEHSDDA